MRIPNNANNKDRFIIRFTKTIIELQKSFIIELRPGFYSWFYCNDFIIQICDQDGDIITIPMTMVESIRQIKKR